MVKRLIGLAVLALLTAAPATAVDLDDVIQMLEADVDEEVILRVIDSEGSLFQLTAEDIIDLRYAGASDRFLEEMLDRSVDRPRKARSTYRVYDTDPYDAYYISIGTIYDPFDYYFVTWPYYYAYVAPFHFSWSWWYYGGPYHAHWCTPYSWRVYYYDNCWGARTVWDRGYGTSVYHVPRYDVSEKVARRIVYDRPAPTSRVFHHDGQRTRRVFDRESAATRVTRGTTVDRSTRVERPVERRGPTWGRSERPSRLRAPSRPGRSEVRPQRPASPSAPSRPSRSEVRPQHRSQPAAPSRPSRSGVRSQQPSRSGSPAAPAPPSRGSSGSRAASPRPSRGGSR